MKKIGIIFLIFCLFLITGCEEEKEVKKNTTLHHAEIMIKDYGTIKVELNESEAPITVKNFIDLAEKNFYDGLTFHRIIKDFMMQGGDATGTEKENIAHTITGEFSANRINNSLKHTRGAISMARSNAYNSASSQFFIVQEDSPHLDGNYAAFGYVIDGMDIVDKICDETEVTDDNGSVSVENRPVIETIKITD